MKNTQSKQEKNRKKNITDLYNHCKFLNIRRDYLVSDKDYEQFINTNIPHTIYDRIDDLLKKNHKSKVDMGEKTGISINTINKLWQRRSLFLKSKYLTKFAEYLGVDPIEFFFDSKEIKGLQSNSDEVKRVYIRKITTNLANMDSNHLQSLEYLTSIIRNK